jgi:hypothetical protein
MVAELFGYRGATKTAARIEYVFEGGARELP